jgi:hypothetical protein
MAVDRYGFSSLEESHQYQLGDFLVDLAIFRERGEFYAAWFCRDCRLRVETERCASSSIANLLAEGGISSHFYEKHQTGREAGG